ncbi:hypothetical protein BaRGS_00013891 [Batillaria attramentaria]|uniref:Uncharacterized protein n=1 Tax=Batillaria attramentaria TaxID=370345 RepID=A0ABD0L5R4_9CAEN
MPGSTSSSDRFLDAIFYPGGCDSGESSSGGIYHCSLGSLSQTDPEPRARKLLEIAATPTCRQSHANHSYTGSVSTPDRQGQHLRSGAGGEGSKSMRGHGTQGGQAHHLY